MNMPYGAQRILDARMQGDTTTELVIVSLVGQLDEGNPVVLADGPEHDWRFCHRLQVCIFGKVGTQNRQTALAIGANRPTKLYLWDMESKEGIEIIPHIRLSSIHKRKGEFKTSDWTAILWPWSAWQNKQFEEARVCN